MRKLFALLCALSLLASLFVLAYVEAETLLAWPDAVYKWFGPWFPLAMIFCSLGITLVIPWLAGLLCDEHPHL